MTTAASGRLRVMHVLEAIFGGTATHLCDLVSVTRDVDHIVVVPSQRFGHRTDELAVAMLREAGAEVHVIDMRRTPTHVDNLIAFFKLARLIRKSRPDVVHGHSSIGGALGRAAALVRPGTPTVWTPNGVLMSRPVLMIERLLARITSTTIAVSPSEEELIHSARLDKAAEVVTIANGIDLETAPEQIDLRAYLGIPDGVPVVGCVSRLVPQKAPLDFVACCRAIHAARPDTHFILVGDGELQSDVEAAVADWEHGGNFHHVPYMPGASRAIGSFDVFVMLSRYEGAPYAPLEAMRAGVPVVLTDVVGSRDAVEPGATGFLVAPGDVEAAARATVQLIDSPEDRSTMAKAGYLRLYGLFDREIMGASLSDLYHRLTGVDHDEVERLAGGAAALDAPLPEQPTASSPESIDDPVEPHAQSKV